MSHQILLANFLSFKDVVYKSFGLVMMYISVRESVKYFGDVICLVSDKGFVYFRWDVTNHVTVIIIVAKVKANTAVSTVPQIKLN